MRTKTKTANTGKKKGIAIKQVNFRTRGKYAANLVEFALPAMVENNPWLFLPPEEITNYRFK